MNKKEEILNKMITTSSGLYYISINNKGEILKPDEELNFPGSGVITYYRDTPEQLIEDVKETFEVIRGYGSPYGNKTCKWS